MRNLGYRARSFFVISVLCSSCALIGACSSDAAGGHRDTQRAGSGGAAGVAGAGAGTLAGDGAFAGNAGAAGGTGVIASGGSGGTGSDAGMQTVITLDQCGADNPAGLSSADVQTLTSAGAPGAMRYLYPYDGTVFPRGLIAPTLMWEGSDAATAVHVHLHAGGFEYRGCLTPTGPGQLLIPQDVWEMAEAQTRGESDPLTIDLSVLEGGAAKGPITEQVVIAQATLKGSIFYNSYNSMLSSGQGAVLRVVPGQNAELFVGGATPGCNGCHAVSANGSRLVTTLVTSGSNMVYGLEPTTPANPPSLLTTAAASFVGLSPDGSVYVTNASPPGGPALRAGTTGPAKMIETDTGTEIAGSGVPTGAMMPTFSPDGSLLVFNDNEINVSHGLALMDYDAATRTASNYRAIFESTDAAKLPSWPFVLPDNKAVVFQVGVANDFSGGNVGISFGNIVPGLDQLLGGILTGVTPAVGPYGNLFIADIASGTSTLLAKAMGYATPADEATKTTYLPFGAADLDQTYYPTVSPVAAGGYFWVFFDSMRNYGNKGLHRQLWGTALTISADGSYTSDPSHPAFFLTGQEEGTGNHRAFTALDPCRADGESCETGIDCCGGFCTDGMCDVPDQPRCAQTDEACTTRADCCNEADSCINGFCGQIGPE